MNPTSSAFVWLLIAFPAYLLLRGRFIDYLGLAADTIPVPASQDAGTDSTKDE